MGTQLTIILWTNSDDQSLAHQLATEACAQVRRSNQMPCEIAHAEVTPLEPADVQEAKDAFADAAAADIIAERVNEAAPLTPVGRAQAIIAAAHAENRNITPEEAAELDALGVRAVGVPIGQSESNGEETAEAHIDSMADVANPPEVSVLSPGEPAPQVVDDKTLVELFAALPDATRDALDEKVVTRSDAEAAVHDAYAELGLIAEDPAEPETNAAGEVAPSAE